METNTQKISSGKNQLLNNIKTDVNNELTIYLDNMFRFYENPKPIEQEIEISP